jgi:hypothetical protein
MFYQALLQQPLYNHIEIRDAALKNIQEVRRYLKKIIRERTRRDTGQKAKSSWSEDQWTLIGEQKDCYL